MVSAYQEAAKRVKRSTHSNPSYRHLCGRQHKPSSIPLRQSPHALRPSPTQPKPSWQTKRKIEPLKDLRGGGTPQDSSVLTPKFGEGKHACRRRRRRGGGDRAANKQFLSVGSREGEAPAAGNATSSREVSTLLFMSGRVSEKAPFNLFFLCQGIILLSFAQEIAQEENPEGTDGKNPWGAKYDAVFDAVFGGFRGRGRGEKGNYGFGSRFPCLLLLLAVFEIGRGGDFLGAPFLPPQHFLPVSQHCRNQEDLLLPVLTFIFIGASTRPRSTYIHTYSQTHRSPYPDRSQCGNFFLAALTRAQEKKDLSRQKGGGKEMGGSGKRGYRKK